MARFLAQKGLGGSLRPVDAIGEEALRKIKAGAIVTIEVKQPRNVRFHRMYWGLVHIVWENMPEDRYPTPEDLHAAFKIAAGIRTRIELPSGEVGFIPGSIAFHAMTEDEFSAFYDRICDLVAKFFLPGVDKDDLRLEVANMIGLPAVAA
jgi:hypothetical protein